ncbi:MAG TPA: hypothetical protein VM513_36335 [Kofleriaceae bacterium]|nr:hypothetical protein [Kofleriaceae bacterium]
MSTVARHASRLGLVALCVLVASCASRSTSIERTWTSRDAQLGELDAVATMFVTDDVRVRHTSEERMAAALLRSGIYAVPSYRILGDAPLGREETRARLRAARLDGVVSMRVVSQGEERHVRTRSSFGYRGLPWTTTSVEAKPVTQVETVAYSERENRVIWASLSKAIDPESVVSMVERVTQIVTREMNKDGIISA